MDSISLLSDECDEMNEKIIEYIGKIKSKMEHIFDQRTNNVRTTNYTMIKFTTTKRNRLWFMKMSELFVDGILCSNSGYQEIIHIDIVRKLIPTNHFWKNPRKIVKDIQMIQYNTNLTDELLFEIVHFAYHKEFKFERTCSSNLRSVIEFASNFNVTDLIQYCFTYFMNHCSPELVLKTYELATKPQFHNRQAKLFFQRYIEDNIKFIWNTNKTDFLNLDFQLVTTLLRSDRLNITNEMFIWTIIHDWVEHQIATRLEHLSPLLKCCLRFGRLSESSIKNIIYQSKLFLTQNENIQIETKNTINTLLEHFDQKLLIKDGYGLMYSKVSEIFRPRETKHILLAAGGWVDGRTSQLIEMYDYQSNLWLSSPVKLKQTVSYFGFEIIDSTIYVFGGSNGREIYRSLFTLDLTKPKAEWINKCSMLERRCYLSSVVLDGNIYAIGGFNQQERIRKCERYEPDTDRWLEIANLNYSRSDASTVTHNGRIYIAGGINDNTVEPSVEVYFPDVDRWILVKEMFSPRTSFSVTCFNGRIWAIGGNNGTVRLNTCESYDPNENEWRREKPMINIRSTFKAVNMNNELYAVGGYNGQSPICNVEKYVSNHGWVKARHLRHERSGMALLSIPNSFRLFRI